MTCWVRSARRAACSVGRASASSKASVCRLWVPPSTPASASIATRTRFTSGCWAVSETPAVWVWKRSWHERAVGRPVALAHPAGPDAPRGAVLGDLLEEVDVGVEEEAEPRRELVDRQARRQGGLDVGEPVGQREGQLLGGRRARLADVVARDRDGMPARHLGRCRSACTSVTRRTEGRGGKTYSFCAWYSFKMSFWRVPESAARATPVRSATPTYMARTGAAGELIVIDVVTRPRSMPAKRVSMSASVSIATPPAPPRPWRGGRRSPARGAWACRRRSTARRPPPAAAP